MAAQAANDFKLMTVYYGDIVSQIMAKGDMMAAIQHELASVQHSFQDVPELFRL